MSGSQNSDIATASPEGGAAATMTMRGKCVDMGDCIHHLGGHCLNLTALQQDLIPLSLPVAAGPARIQREETADVAAPGALLRPPIA